MATTTEERWQKKYQELKEYILEHHQLPDKKKVENRRLLNWWKYNKKRIKEGKMSPEKMAMLQELSDMRELKQGMLKLDFC